MKCSRQPWNLIAVAALCASVSGCSTVKFYSQAIQGQREIVRNARTVELVLHDAAVPKETKRKLALAEEARSFASGCLLLPAGRNYDRYTDLGRHYVSWVVYAAPEFSVEGKTWWYPMLGKLAYRGYFSKADADAEAARLKAGGYEVHVGGVEAYSTLGWFRDPVLNTFLRRTGPELAELIFHELTHVRLFLAGDTDFNEAFATANAEAGVRRWLSSKGDTRALASYDAALRKDREIVRLLLATREELKRLYADTSHTTLKMRRMKAAVFDRMKDGYARIRRQWQADSRYDRQFAKPWNNARLNTVATYYDLVPGFERLLKAHDGNLRSFYAAVEKMGAMRKPSRQALLRGTETERMSLGAQ